MNGPRETRPASDAPIGAFALHRDMRDQALRVPWPEVASACERMAKWRSFSLWVRAVVEAEQALPAWLASVVEERCPAFMQSRRTTAGIDSLWLDLNEWIDHRFFGNAVQAAWLQALHYYCGRMAASEYAWQYWTRMDDEWRANRSARYPTFAEWHAKIEASSQSPSPVGLAAQQYVEWEALSFWVRSLVEAAREIPGVVRITLDEKCPGFIEHVMALRPLPSSDPQWLWEQLLRWIETHSFNEAVREQRLDSLRDTAHRALRSERVIDYWASWTAEHTKGAPPSLPTFEQWLAEADAFVAR